MVVTNVNSGKYLSVSGSSADTNANIHVWSNDGTDGLYFKVVENSDGTYSFMSKASGFSKAVGIPNSSTTEGASVKQLAQSNSNNIKFNLSADKAVVYLCTSGFSLGNSINSSWGGHAWLEVMNVSDSSFSIGYYSLAVGEYMSVSAFKKKYTQWNMVQ